ncbi:hypothetical protein OUZ56_009631 [Daphnia magna]|uniref:Amidase domain-containing protein n=1 Tax=Daphnia magna TaxID=35525 RepID=A0ABR0AGL2_9CRUS|nr:hypothetical protein OUZ56_009631 [Daphnia magna]
MLNKLLLGRLLFPADADAVLSGEKGPLHGLPFSVKDNCGIIGYDSTIRATGMPLEIQIVGLPYEEEMDLHGMDALDAAIRQ